MHYPGVIGLCETHLYSDIPDSVICPQGYSIYRKDRNKYGGGVALLFRADIMVKHVEVHSMYEKIELICSDIIINGATFRIILYYRPPHYNLSDLEYLSTSIDCISSLLSACKHNTILLGDFNMPNVDWIHYSAPSNPFYDIFLQFINNCGLHQYVFVPTRNNKYGNGNILDLVFSNMYNIISDLEILCPFSTSDHNMLKFSVNLPCNSDTVVTPAELYYDYKNADFDQLAVYMSSINWLHEFSFVFSTEDYWQIFLTHLSYAVQLYVPIKKRQKPDFRNRKHYPKNIRKLLSQKAMMWKKWRLARDNKSKKSYEASAIKCKKAISVYHSNIELKLIEKNNVGQFFKFVNNKLSSHITIAPIKDAKGLFTADPLEQSNLFNQYFASVFTVDDGKQPKITSRVLPNCSISNVDFNPTNVFKVLKSLKSKTSHGPDGLPNILFKNLANVLCSPLAFIFESSFRSHTLPTCWLHAFITPVFKKGLTSELSNYRPISLTCVCCRIMERVINMELIDYLTKNGLITKYQHGFLRKHSTCSNLLESVNDWSLNLKNCATTDIIFIDFKKAFDSVSHQKLICKIESYGVQGDLLEWIKAFLKDRTQAVKIDNCISSNIAITSGVPQGSVLGPLLFLLYINDITDIAAGLDVNLKLFADDAKLYSSFSCDFDSSSDLLNACHNLTVWAETWQLQIATEKCFVHRVTNRDPHIQHTFNCKSPYLLDTNLLSWSKDTRDLGIIMDSKLTFNLHISSIAHKAHIRAKLILRSFTSRDKAILTKAFLTYVRPLLEYCSPVWSPHTLGNINKVEAVQRRFTKSMHGLSSLSYIDRLRKLSLETLELRRLKQDLVMCFKIIHGEVEIDPVSFFTFSTHCITRGHKYKLLKHSVRVDACKFSFANRVFTAWNNLPATVVDVVNAKLFSAHLNNVNLSQYCVVF